MVKEMIRTEKKSLKILKFGFDRNCGKACRVCVLMCGLNGWDRGSEPGQLGPQGFTEALRESLSKKKNYNLWVHINKFCLLREVFVLIEIFKICI